jgi:hypothetical protein
MWTRWILQEADVIGLDQVDGDAVRWFHLLFNGKD